MTVLSIAILALSIVLQIVALARSLIAFYKDNGESRRDGK